jgi:hypothetical protein
MGSPVEFKGQNNVLKAPKGRDNLSCSDLPVFNNKVSSTSCWQLSQDEIEEIVKTGKIYVTVWFGMSQPPIYVGDEESTRGLIADNGVWSK